MAEIEPSESLSELRSESEERETGSKHGSSASDMSSIEALNWSDFEDDLNEEDSKLLQSINSQLSEMSENASGLRNRNKTLTQEQDDETTISESATTLKNESQFGDQNSSMKTSEIPVIMATSTHSVASELLAFDTVSNVPVLDDGPIWAKGSKLYKFEENRRFNQKLTFCVLFSVVLAIGLGIGNLAAYNECEAEHKSSTMGNGNLDEKIGPSMEEISGKVSLVQPESRLPNVNPIPKQSDAIPEPIKTVKVDKPMIDPQYAAHAEELARVLKMLDELSRKIDRFENTTRQLGGIVMLRDDIIHPDAATKKSKFLGLLDEIMKEKGKKQKKGMKEDIEQPLNWRAKKEQVLDEIAEAVLGAMDVHEESFKENKDKEANLEVEPTFQSYAEPETFHPKPKPEVEKIPVFTDTQDELPETTVEVEPTLEKLTTDHEEVKKVKKEKKYKHKKSKHSRGEHEDDEISPDKVFEKRKKRHTDSDSPKPPKTKRSSNEKRNRSKSDSSNSTNDGNKNGKNKSCREKDKKEKGKKEERQESFKNKKNKVEVKSDSKDWLASRAKLRQEGRAKMMTAWNKKANNWMSDRYEEREKLRNKKVS